jgi:hypothetical protein
MFYTELQPRPHTLHILTLLICIRKYHENPQMFAKIQGQLEFSIAINTLKFTFSSFQKVPPALSCDVI